MLHYLLFFRGKDGVAISNLIADFSVASGLYPCQNVVFSGCLFVVFVFVQVYCLLFRV